MNSPIPTRPAHVTPPLNPQHTRDPSTPPDKTTESERQVHAKGMTDPYKKPGQSGRFHRSNLDTMRTIVAQHTGDIPVLTLDEFRKHLLPQSLSDDQIKEVIDSTNVDFIKSLIKHRRTESTKLKLVEPEFFKHIKEVLEEVGGAGTRMGLNQTGGVDYRPNSTPIGCEKSGWANPDCNILLRDSTLGGGNYEGQTFSYDIFGELQLKKKRDPVDVHEVSSIHPFLAQY